jgi:hypothetical protein
MMRSASARRIGKRTQEKRLCAPLDRGRERSIQVARASDIQALNRQVQDLGHVGMEGELRHDAGVGKVAQQRDPGDPGCRLL